MHCSMMKNITAVNHVICIGDAVDGLPGASTMHVHFCDQDLEVYH